MFPTKAQVFVILVEWIVFEATQFLRFEEYRVLDAVITTDRTVAIFWFIAAILPQSRD